MGSYSSMDDTDDFGFWMAVVGPITIAFTLIIIYFACKNAFKGKCGSNEPEVEYLNSPTFHPPPRALNDVPGTQTLNCNRYPIEDEPVQPTTTEIVASSTITVSVNDDIDYYSNTHQTNSDEFLPVEKPPEYYAVVSNVNAEQGMFPATKEVNIPPPTYGETFKNIH